MSDDFSKRLFREGYTKEDLEIAIRGLRMAKQISADLKMKLWTGVARTAEETNVAVQIERSNDLFCGCLEGTRYYKKFMLPFQIIEEREHKKGLGTYGPLPKCHQCKQDIQPTQEKLLFDDNGLLCEKCHKETDVR